jgi:hypothetical protein
MVGTSGASTKAVPRRTRAGMPERSLKTVTEQKSMSTALALHLRLKGSMRSLKDAEIPKPATTHHQDITGLLGGEARSMLSTMM